jgi:integrase
MNQPRLSAAAVTKQIRSIQSLLSWSVNNGYIEANPALGISVVKAKEVADKRVSFDANDLKAILSGLGQFRGSEPSKFWLPLLAMFTGARAGELIQLGVDDICCQDGIDYLSINAEGGKSVKTRSSVRELPLHPELVKIGFLDYVAEHRTAGDERLFPNLRRGAQDRVAERFSKWFMTYRRSLGITDERKPFHSFRHTFKEACRAAGMTEEIHDALTGHRNGSVGRGYGGVPLQTKAEAIKRIRYDVRLDHLYP